MPLTESLIAKAIAAIVKQSAQKTWKSLSRDARVLNILKVLGLKPDRPDRTFDSVYVHAVVEYGEG